MLTATKSLVESCEVTKSIVGSRCWHLCFLLALPLRIHKGLSTLRELCGAQVNVLRLVVFIQIRTGRVSLRRRARKFGASEAVRGPRELVSRLVIKPGVKLIFACQIETTCVLTRPRRISLLFKVFLEHVDARPHR